ncbi:MAG: protease complex subunit PrcB family protein [Candidatus Pacebacteria bacterium]|nr:protease complex subunit PrcB family protein [Candidatus Paceibacterota bacterium]
MDAMKRDRLIIVGVALVAVCTGVYLFLSGKFSDMPLPSNAPAAATTVPFTPLVSGSQSAVTDRVNYFITSSDQLSELWKMINASSTPPKVDFNKDAVIAVFAGQQPTTGYVIKVSKIVDSSARLVSITIAKPAESCISGESLTAPYELVAVPLTALPLAHEDLLATANCPK